MTGVAGQTGGGNEGYSLAPLPYARPNTAGAITGAMQQENGGLDGLIARLLGRTNDHGAILRQGPRPAVVTAPEDATDAQSALFRDLLNQLRLRTLNPDADPTRRTADTQQYEALRQIAGMESPLKAMREDAVAALLASGKEQVGQTYDQAGSQLRSTLAGRGLTGSSGSAINTGRIAAGREAGINEAARAAQGFRDETEAASTSMLTQRAQDALGRLEPGPQTAGLQALQGGLSGLVNAGQSQQEYSGLINRLNMDYRNSLSQVLGTGIQNAVGGFINYGFNRADQINADTADRDRRSILGMGPASRTGGSTWAGLR